jgi:amino acid permease
MGWSTYFAFILAAINTLTVTYFLAIDNYPALKTFFPSFEIYVFIIITIGVPLLIFIGYSHYKKTKAFRSEMDILVESNPFLRRTMVNTDIILRFNINLINLVLKLSKDTISEDELNNMKKIQKEITDLVKNRSFINNLDIDYLKKNIREKSDYMM